MNKVLYQLLKECFLPYIENGAQTRKRGNGKHVRDERQRIFEHKKMMINIQPIISLNVSQLIIIVEIWSN